MAEQTKIEWCDATLNLWWGCTKVSDGCKHCYAENLSDQRYKKCAWGPTGIRTEVKSWRSTLNKISKRAKAEGRRLKVFCQSMSDTFEGPETCGGRDSQNSELMDRLRVQLFGQVIPAHPELDFLILTKRPQFAAEWLGSDQLIPNIWIGTSVEDQKTADERIPHLLRIPAQVRFLSCEPILGPVDLNRFWIGQNGEPLVRVGDVWFDRPMAPGHHWHGADINPIPAVPVRIHWVIAGGESGPNARPMHPDWARSLRDQCVTANVPFFFKQWGEWAPLGGSGVPHDSDDETSWPWVWVTKDGVTKKSSDGYQDRVMVRVGKARAGRLLDGREWSQFPKVNP